MRHSSEVAALVALALWLCLGSAPTSAAALHDCGYFKTSPAALYANLNTFVADVSTLVSQREDLRSAVAEGQDITEDIYSAGLLGRVDDCIHDKAGRNIEVTGGFVTVSELDAWRGAIGFTVIVRGLRFQQCENLAHADSTNPKYYVRGEPPGEPPRNFGDCISLPSWLRFGSTLPQPNTAYIMKYVQAGEVAISPSDSQACGLFQQIKNEGGGRVCSYYRELLSMLNNCHPEFDSTDCQAALQCQSAALAELRTASNKLGLESLGFDQRIRLYEEAVWGARDKAIKAGYYLYLIHPDGFIDPQFGEFLETKVGVIAGSLKDELDMPTSFNYFRYKNEEKEAFLQSIADIVWSELEVSRFEIGFDYLPDLDLTKIRTSGTYDSHGRSLSLNMNNMFLNVADGLRVRDAHIDTLLHEAFHHYQHELVLEQSRCDGGMEAADPRYRQTHVFAINKFANFQGGDAAEYPKWELAYRGNPIEQTARHFSQAVRKAWQR